MARGARKGRGAVQVSVLVGLVGAIGAVAFALQNDVAVTVTFLVWRFDGSLAMVLLIALATGALLMALVSTPLVLRLQWRVASQGRRIHALEAANEALRARPEGTGASQPDSRTSSLAHMAPRAPSDSGR